MEATEEKKGNDKDAIFWLKRISSENYYQSNVLEEMLDAIKQQGIDICNNNRYLRTIFFMIFGIAGVLIGILASLITLKILK